MALKAIPNCLGYSITKNGRVRNTGTGKWLTPVDVRGYKAYNVGARYNPYPACRLVLETFVGPCPKGLQCCHRNDDKQDDRLENLYWGTPYENKLDARRNREQNKRPNHRSKLTYKQAAEIRRRLRNGVTGKKLAKRFRVSEVTISGIKNKKHYLEV